ncbi:MAG: aminopeptidase [Deltaproteobacteria bacterium]|nr:aminopeptidase [Deltaproteobacteria bacterium]
MVSKKVKPFCFLFGLMTILTVFAGCKAGYVMHAALGQIRLLSSAVPVDDALAGNTLGASQKERLALVSRIKKFGEEQLGLKKTSNYETIYLGSDQPPVFTLAAAPKDKLILVTWWFPVVGRMPYLGFFDLPKAEREKQKLLDKDLDVVIGRADAFSTLGWFRDPITLNLIDGSEVDLVEIILHEMTHTTLYVKGQGAFNEGLAQIVGKRGALQFFEKTLGPSHPLTLKAMDVVEDERLFSAFLISLFRKLDHLYASSLSIKDKVAKREEIFTACLKDFEILKMRLKTKRFVHFGRAPLNNAYLMAFGLYHRYFPLFEALLDRHGGSIPEMLLFFRNLSKEKSDLLAAAAGRIGEP